MASRPNVVLPVQEGIGKALNCSKRKKSSWDLGQFDLEITTKEADQKAKQPRMSEDSSATKQIEPSRVLNIPSGGSAPQKEDADYDSPWEMISHVSSSSEEEPAGEPSAGVE